MAEEQITHFFPTNLAGLTATSPFVTLNAYESVVTGKENMEATEKRNILFNVSFPAPNEQLSMVDSHSYEETAGMGSILTGKALELLKNMGGSLVKYGEASSGKVLNDLSALIYNGPNFRTLELSWTFMPESSNDSTVLDTIIRKIRKYTYPGGNISQALLDYPLFWDLKVNYKSNILISMQSVVIENMSVNFSGGPEGTLATFHDGKPIITTLSLTFKQLYKSTRNSIEAGI